MIGLVCFGKAVAIVTLSVFVIGLASLRTQSELDVEPRSQERHPVVLPADTLLAIGDLHGDLEQGYAALKLAGLVNRNDRWSGGQATLVQTGDLLDRGPKSIELVQLFERLKGEAAAAGGAVHTLMGNHETMNLLGDYRYVSQEELAALGSLRKPPPLTLEAALHAGQASWRRHMQEDVGSVLRQRPVAVMLGQGTCKSLFIHAGLPLQLMLEVAQQASSFEPDILLEKLNTLVQGAVQNCSEGRCTKYQGDLLTGGNSPVWYRGYVQDYEAKLCPEVQQVVQNLKVVRSPLTLSS
ncbi:hypothetical protein ABBQ32_009587 [Trebouxia sp. C0010 RCD-2024]